MLSLVSLRRPKQDRAEVNDMRVVAHIRVNTLGSYCGKTEAERRVNPVFPSFHVASTRLMSLARAPAPA